MFNKGKADDFNKFICQNDLQEMSLGGRKFTWVGQGGLKLSKLDHFLLTRSLMDEWQGTFAIVLPRNFSDHCLILLKSLEVDFGPTPFRFFDH